MMRITERAHDAISGVVRAGDLVIDATVGNGHDTLFLAGLVGPAGRVIGFDIQEQALRSARQRVGHLPQVTLVRTGHEQLAETVADNLPPGTAVAAGSGGPGPVAAVMFNLGYLPGSSKTVTTKPVTTVTGIEQALRLLRPGGVLTAITYSGHPGGAEEAAVVLSALGDAGADYSVRRYRNPDGGANAPELLTVVRLADRTP